MPFLSFFERRVSTAGVKSANGEARAEQVEPKTHSPFRHASMLRIKFIGLRKTRHKSTSECAPESSDTEESNLLSPTSPVLRSKWFDEEDVDSVQLFPMSPALRSGWFDEPEVDRPTKWLKRLLRGRQSPSKERAESTEEEALYLGLDGSESMHWVAAEKSPRVCLGTRRQSSEAEILDPFMKAPARPHYAQSFFSNAGMESRLSMSSWRGSSLNLGV